MLSVVEDRVHRGNRRPRGLRARARIRVAVESREVAARDVDAQAVSLQEDVRGRPELDPEAVDGPRNHGLGLLHRVPVARPEDPVRQVDQ